jgi:hypothetical protein
MILFLDNQFLEEFLGFDDSDDLKYDFHKTVIKRSKGYELYTSMSEKEFDENVLNRHLSEILEGCLKVTLDYSANQFLQLKNIHKILLLNNNNELDEKNGYVYFTTNNISQKWDKYNNDRSFKLSTTVDPGIDEEDRFSKWVHLKKYYHPIETLLIYDNYLLTNGRNQKIRQNLIPMIKAFHEMSPSTKKNIMIFGLKETNFFLDDEIQDLKGVIRKIKNEIGDEHNVRIISHKKDDHFPHDRFIYTNIYLIERGKGFNIFDQNENIYVQDSTSPIRFQFTFNKGNYSHHRCVRKEFDKLIRETESGKLEVVSE